MPTYSAKLAGIFDSLSEEERQDLIRMLENGVSVEVAEELLQYGCREAADTGVGLLLDDTLAASIDGIAQRQEHPTSIPRRCRP